MLSHVIEPKQLWPELQTWSRLILPADYCRRDLMQHSSTLLKMAKEQGAGYKYRTQTIIERLKISSDEERQMKALISKDEKQRRDREAWRADHTGMDRQTWLSENSTEASKPWEAEGISRRTWYRRQAKNSM